MALTHFHPAVAQWFASRFVAPTAVQNRAWPEIRERNNTLITAPTGSGKTLAAFLAVIDQLIRKGLNADLDDQIKVVYVSPLKALSNDIHKNLELPLAGIRAALKAVGCGDVDIRSAVRTGDTSQAERERIRRQPPHILVTTPESLYILLTSASGRAALGGVETVIVDEIHAVAGNKRGTHLSLSLERLDALRDSSDDSALLRIGLSATQKPVEEIAAFLTGSEPGNCSIIDNGHLRPNDIALTLLDSPLQAVMANEVWDELYDRLASLAAAHKTTLIFVNTRRYAERIARHLGDRLGTDNVTSYHGSLSYRHRLEAERRLRDGQLTALVATSSLELGIDIGDVDLVCQLGSPRTIAAFLQRVGRSGHALDRTPKGRLFPLSRDDLIECAALIDAIRQGQLDRIRIPDAPLDVLAQQIVAEVANCDWQEEALYRKLTKAYPYRLLDHSVFTSVVRMLADGYTTRRGRRAAYLHYDAVNGRLRPRQGARLAALTNGGTIADQFDYDVVLQPQGQFIGTLNEDFAFESMAGDIFQLGNASYRILKTEQGKVHVEDAQGQPPNIPFWFGEAPGRSDELSRAVSDLRRRLHDKLRCCPASVEQWLVHEYRLEPVAAREIVTYLESAHAVLGTIPSQDTLVFERFFDDMGDMHLVIHSAFGSRLNRAWGLALRKRFCRKFNFELQAAALEDSIVLSLGPTHSFPLDDVCAYLKSQNVRELLVQALLDTPIFTTHWRWVTNIALAVARRRGGKRVPPQFQRSDAEDLVAQVFPEQLACLENISGNRELPDHPLVVQTLGDCLHGLMDIEGLEKLLQRLENGELQVICRDLPAPSPLAAEILNARPYAFLDDAPAEERRTQTIRRRGLPDAVEAASWRRPDEAAIQFVRRDAWPVTRTADELHAAMYLLGFLTNEETRTIANAQCFFSQLADERRVTSMLLPDGTSIWVCAERLAECRAILPHAELRPVIAPYRDEHQGREWTAEQALTEIVRSRLNGLGPVACSEIAASLACTGDTVMSALLALEQEGYVIRGQFSDRGDEIQWCERSLLARIHKQTLKRRRDAVQPVPASDFMRFLMRWQRLDDRGQGKEALAATLEQLEGCCLPAVAWERDILPARVAGFVAQDLDELCAGGRFVWQRLHPPEQTSRLGESRSLSRRPPSLHSIPIALMPRRQMGCWLRDAKPAPEAHGASNADKVLRSIRKWGASLATELVEDTGLLPAQLEDALAQLVVAGQVSSDQFAGLRALLTGYRRRAPRFGPRSRPGARHAPIEDAGRWFLIRHRDTGGSADASIEHIARVLLRRYGVVFRKLLERETGLPQWRDLLYVFERLEARGEVRAGRFLDGLAGQQFALPEAATMLRTVSRQEKYNELIAVSAADPVNLLGIIVPGERIPALAGNRILFRDGIPIAVAVSGAVRYLEKIAVGDEWSLRSALLRRASVVELR